MIRRKIDNIARARFIHDHRFLPQLPRLMNWQQTVYNALLNFQQQIQRQHFFRLSI